MALLNFNAASVEPSQDFEALPAGDYVALISDSTMKPTKAGTGQYLELVFTVLEGSHKNRKVYTRLNVNNPNAKAVQIAMGELSAICRAVGKMEIKDSAELHNKPLVIKVVRDEYEGKVRNEVKAYRATGSGPVMPKGVVPSEPKIVAVPKDEDLPF